MAAHFRLRVHYMAYDCPPFGTVIVVLPWKNELDDLVVCQAMGEGQSDTALANVDQCTLGSPPAAQFRNEYPPPTCPPRVHPSLFISDLPDHDHTLREYYKTQSVNHMSQR